MIINESSIKENKKTIKIRLDKEDKYRHLLFRRGYLITNKNFQNLSSYPFYNQWNKFNINDFYIYVHNDQTIYYKSNGPTSVAILGHAYNPFDKTFDEEILCKQLIDAYNKDLVSYFDQVNMLTGLHLIVLFDGNRLIACQDACALTGCNYGKIGNEIYIAEHSQLISDLCDIRFNPMVVKLVNSKCYNIGNRHLPGDITPYDGVKRNGGNTYIELVNGEFKVKRFYPLQDHPEYRLDEEKDEITKKIGELIHNGVECCTRKWEKCAISLTGGTDSKTTLACANGLYSRFEIFSFISKPQEQVDAIGAKTICDAIGLTHTLIRIPSSNNEISDFEFLKAILLHNGAYSHSLADHEVRKYIHLHNINKYDVELKSWASEVTRVFLERKYQIKMPKILTERHFSIFQTRYFLHPRLLKWSDQKYFEFLKNIGLEKPLFNFEHSDLFYWEIRMGAWGASVISSQQAYHRVTIPMNNRKILEMFLSLPREDRIKDLVHQRIMTNLNPAVLQAGIEIPNLYFHSYRIYLEKIYYLFRTIFYRPRKK